MSNPIFYASDMSNAVFTGSIAEDALYPLSNLNTNLPSLIWRSDGGYNDQTLIVDMGSIKGCDFLALGAYNWSGMTTVKLQVGTTDDGAFDSPVDLFTSIPGAPAAPVVFTFGYTTRRYWRILFSDTNDLIPECGLLLLGAKMQMPFNYNMDAETGNKKFATTAKESLSGILRTSRQTAGRKRMEITFTLIDNSTVINWLRVMDAIQGRLNPFFFKDADDTLDIWHSEDDYVPAKGVRANVNDLARIKMCKQTTG